MGRNNDDGMRVIAQPHRNHQDGTPAKRGTTVLDGYATLDQAEPGRERQGMAPDVKRSHLGRRYYRPHGR